MMQSLTSHMIALACTSLAAYCRAVRYLKTTLSGFASLANGQKIDVECTPCLCFHCITLLQAAAAKQERPCKHSNVSDWALRASEPHTRPLPDTQQLPAPPVYLPQHSGSCNSYLPDTDGLGRLLWTVQYFVANGFYVTVGGSRGNCQLAFL